MMNSVSDLVRGGVCLSRPVGPSVGAGYSAWRRLRKRRAGGCGSTAGEGCGVVETQD